MATQFDSRRYRSFKTWQKVLFWLGVLSFLNLTYWIVRLILYLVLQKRPLRERVDAYALQTLVFGTITAVAVGIALVIGLLVLTLVVPVAVLTTY